MNSEKISKGTMESHKNLLKVGFTPEQIERLSQFCSDYIERGQRLIMSELRRLEFVRLLVATGRLTD